MVKPPCKPDCRDRGLGCKRTCAAYFVYEVAKNKAIEERFSKKNGGDITSYEMDKYYRVRKLWMKSRRKIRTKYRK